MPGTHIPEILEMIAGFTDDETLLSLRRVSRLHNQTSLRAFGDAWFDVMYIDFSLSSIKRLLFVASNDVLRRRVLKVRAMVKFGLGVCADETKIWPSRITEEDRVRSPGAPFISWALRKLERCTELEILDIFPYYTADIAAEPVVHGIEAIHMILSIFNYEDCPPIRSVTIEDKSLVPRRPEFTESMMMLTDMTHSPSFRCGWGSRVRNITCNGSLNTPNVPYVSNIIQAATKLESLELTAQYTIPHRVQLIPDTPTMHPMTHLAIWCIRTTPELLAMSVIRYRSTLKSLDLSWVWMPADVEMWAIFFELLSESDFPCLTKVWARELMGVSEDGTGEAVHFRNLIGATEALEGCTGRFESAAGYGHEVLSGLRYTGPPETMSSCFRAFSQGVSEAYAPFPEVDDGPLPEAIGSLVEAFGDTAE